VDFLRQLQDAAPQMATMSQQVGAGMGHMLALMQELVRLNGAGSGYQVKQGTTTNRPQDNEFRLGVACRALDLTIEGNDANVELSYDGNVFGPPFYVKAGVVYSLPFTARAVRVYARAAGAQAVYQVVAMV
jgi:hypothetical protein